MQPALSKGWQRWWGGPWPFSPDTLVHVRFFGTPDLCDENMDPVPASYWGTDPNRASNWVGPLARIDEFRIWFGDEKCEKCGFLHYRTDPCRKPKPVAPEPPKPKRKRAKDTRKGDRHSPGYMAKYLRDRRAKIKASKPIQ